MKLKISKRKIMLVEKLIKEEFGRQFNKLNLVEIVDDDPMTLIREAEDPEQLTQAFIASGEKPKPESVSGIAKLSAAAGEGDQEAAAELSQSAEGVDVEGGVKKVQAILEDYNGQLTGLQKKFVEALAEAGWGGVPAAQELVTTMNKAASQIQGVLEKGFEGVEKAGKALNDVKKGLKGGKIGKAKLGGDSKGLGKASGKDLGGKGPPGALSTIATGLTGVAGAAMREQIKNRRKR